MPAALGAQCASRVHMTTSIATSVSVARPSASRRGESSPRRRPAGWDRRRRAPVRGGGKLTTTGSSSRDDADVSSVPPVDPNAPPRWDLVHARAVAALAEIFANRRDAQKIVRKALRPEWFGPEGAPETPGWAGDARGGGVNNAERAAIADAVLGVEVLRLNLAYLVLERSRSAYEDTLRAAGGPERSGARALHAILREQGVAVSPSSSPSSPPPAPDRAAYRAAAAAMLALYWMTHRVVSNEFARDYLAVLRGGAKLTGDDWPVDPDDAFAVETSVPRWLAARLRAKFGDEDARKLCAEMRRRAPVTIRRNARVCSSAGDLRDALDAEGVATSTHRSGAPARNISKRRRPRPRRPRHPRPRRPRPRLFRRILRARARRTRWCSRRVVLAPGCSG